MTGREALDLRFMERALELAVQAGEAGEVPIGALVAQGDQILSDSRNRMEELQDASAHAEILAIRAACRIVGSERLPGHDLWVTLEPCPMCAAAISS